MSLKFEIEKYGVRYKSLRNKCFIRVVEFEETHGKYKITREWNKAINTKEELIKFANDVNGRGIKF